MLKQHDIVCLKQVYTVCQHVQEAIHDINMKREIEKEEDMTVGRRVESSHYSNGKIFVGV